ncbi:MAG: hypothetical protein ACPGLV_06915 [Bacteroidia bacterium]
MNKNIKLVFFSFILLASCVSPRVVEDLETKLAAIEKAKEDCKEDLEIKEEQLKRNEKLLKEAEEDVKDLNRLNASLEQDTLSMGRNYRRLRTANKDLNEALEKQVAVNKQMAAQSEAKNQQLYSELIKLKKQLDEKEEKLNERDTYLTDLQKDLVSRENKVKELQNAINERDSLMSTLKERITKALLSYEDKGISVKVEGDKVYVSLEEQILFLYVLIFF